MNESTPMDKRAKKVPKGVRAAERMKTPRHGPANTASRLTLEARTAADLMTPNVVSIVATATIQEAAALLTDKNLGAVPVLDENGRAVGVLSRSDIVAYDCATYAYLQPDLNIHVGNALIERLQQRWPKAFPVENACRVRDIMSPVLFSVPPDVPASVVVDAMLTLTVHRLFVTGPSGEVLGVVSAIDVLRHLHQP